MADKIISRVEARAKGLKRFFTGVPCLHGHIAERLVSTEACCECAQIARIAWAKANPEKLRASRTAYCERNAEKVRASHEAWRKRNPDKIRSRSVAWREANPERSRATSASWFKKNPGKRQEFEANRRARKKAAKGSHTAADIQEIYKLQKGRCSYCRIKLNGKYEVDHIIPLSDKGSSNDRKNLQLTCHKTYGNGCNQRKNSKDPLSFARELGMLL